MSRATNRYHSTEQGKEPVRFLGRGLRARQGVRLTIRTVREALGMTQMEVAERAKIDQADVSRMEGRAAFSDYQVSTLERYIGALGGRLDLVAVFGNKRITLTGAGPGHSGAENAPPSSAASQPPPNTHD